MNVLKDYLQLIVSAVTLMSVIFGMLKVFNRQEQVWRNQEQSVQDMDKRLAVAEKTIAELKGLYTDVTAIRVAVTELGRDMEREMERVRNRLDRFLDAQAVVTANRGTAVVIGPAAPDRGTGAV